MRPERDLRAELERPELRRRLLARPHRPDADVLVSEALEPAGERSRTEDRRELDRERLLVGGELPLCEVRTPEERAESLEELRLERAYRHVAPVGRLV